MYERSGRGGSSPDRRGGPVRLGGHTSELRFLEDYSQIEFSSFVCLCKYSLLVYLVVGV